MEPFYQAALEIADRKMFRDTAPTALCSPRIGTGGGFKDIFFWDTVFCCHWAKYHTDRFPLEGSLDNFYRCQEADGFISRQIHDNGKSKWSKDHPCSFAPPLLSWIELDLAEKGMFPGRLEKVYPKLVKLHEYNRKWIRNDGLYFSDGYGCGMDDIPRWDDGTDMTEPGIPFPREGLADTGPEADQRYQVLIHNPRLNFNWNIQVGWIDSTCQAAFDALNLAKIAEKLNRTEEAEKFRQEHHALAEKINELLWDDTENFYKDRYHDRFIRHKHAGAFWTLISETAPAERAEKLFAHLENENTFGLPCGVPGISRDDTSFGLDNTHYWTGPVWCPVMYMVLCGLKAYGQDSLARKIAEKFHHAARRIWEKTGTIWENYSPLQCEEPSKHAAADFCGWSALSAITIPLEFLN